MCDIFSITRDWSSLGDFAMRSLVEHSKESGQRNRDGRNLRLLNKHWSSNIDRYVTQAHPKRGVAV